MKGSKKRSTPEESKDSDGESMVDSDYAGSNAGDDDTILMSQTSLVSASQNTLLSQESISQSQPEPGADEDGKGSGGSPMGVGDKRGRDGGREGPQTKRAKIEQLDEVPLLVPATVCKDNKASLLVHLRDETLNFSGDTGAIGRVAVHGKKTKGSRLTFDLKGQQFDGQIIPSATVLVVGIGRTEAKVEGLFSEVCRLGYKGNVLDAMGGQVLKGEMDASYKFEDEDVNARGGGTGPGGEVTDEGEEAGRKGKGGSSSAKTPKSVGRKKGSSGAKGGGKSSSAKKGGKASSSSSGKGKK